MRNEMLISFAGTMAGDGDQNFEPEWLRNLPLRSEEIGFTPEELVPCTACGRPNAPNRAVCLYCGTTEDLSGTTRFDIRELESWESGFNVVVTGTGDADIDQAAGHLASLLSTERYVMTSVLTAGKALPL